jgi:hypothetical protein
LGLILAVTNLFVKNFSQFQGLDLRSSDLIREPQFCSGMNNGDYNSTNAIVKRKGYQYKTESAGGFGMGVYKDINTTTGAVTETIVSVDDSLHTLTSDSISVTYSGSGTALLDIAVDTSTNKFVLTITEDTTVVLSQNLGLGLDESAATTVATVVSAIDALADYAATGGTVTTGSGAFFDLQRSVSLSATATAINYTVWTAANESSSNPLATSLSNKNLADFENYSFANLNNTLYVGSKYDDLMKYDGQTFYRAGLPAGGDTTYTRGTAGTALTTAEDAAGSTFAQNEAYYYKYLYKQVDNKGNIIEGAMSPVSVQETIAAATADIDVTVHHLTSSSKFNTNCAIVNGAQSSTTTLTVDSGHTFNSGDTAYFYDTVSSSYVTRVITSTTATTIVWAAATSVTVVDNAVISNNLRIGIYRTVDAGSSTGTFKLVAEIPNDSISVTPAVYVDQITDANLGAEFITPIKSPDLPPKGGYLTTFRNLLFIGGEPTNVNTVYYSDVDSPEYFPAASNSFIVDAFAGTKVTGLGALDTAVVVFKDKSVQAVTGDIADDSFRVDELSYGGIGCVSNASIQQILGSLFFLSDKGIFSVNLENRVSEIGRRISPEFTKFDVNFTFKKAISANWVDKDKYILFIPEEGVDGSSNKYATTDSKVYSYDYARDAWLKWDNINAQGGFAFVDNRLYFQSRRLDSDSSAVEFQSAIFNDYGNLNDYTDHQLALDFEYKTHWESLGDPAIYKKFLRLKVFALSSDVLDGEASLYTLTIDTEFNYITPAAIASFTMDFSGGSSGYGNGEWGNAPYGDAAISELKGKLKSLKSRAIRLVFKNEVQKEDILISGYELEAAAAFRPHMKE